MHSQSLNQIRDARAYLKPHLQLFVRWGEQVLPAILSRVQGYPQWICAQVHDRGNQMRSQSLNQI